MMKFLSRNVKQCGKRMLSDASSNKFNNYETARPFEEIPGPKALPLVGTMLKYLPLIGEYSFDRLHHNGHSKLKQFGHLVREQIVPGVNIVWVFDPSDIETVFRNEGRHPQRRSHLALQKYRHDRPDIYNTGGLLPTNGPDWLRLRRAFQKGLSSPINVKSYLPKIDAVIEEFLTHINCETSSLPRDFLSDLSRLYLELICLVAFDVRLGSLTAAELDPNSRSSRMIDAALTTNSCILKLDNGPRLWRYYQTRLYKKLSKALGCLESVALEMVNKKVAAMKSNFPVSENHQISLLELYLTSPDLDTKDVVGMAVDMLLAGIDTTTYTTSIALYYLATNPSKQHLLSAEAKNLVVEPNSPITSDVLAKATYTKAVLKETFRMNPISVGVGRILAQDTVLSGYQVPKGTVVVTQNQVMCRLPEYFRQPDSFIPERWVKGDSELVPVNPYLVLPFGHGPRTCIARRLAEQNMQMFLIKLLRRYQVEWHGRDMDVQSLLINKPDQPILLTFKPI